MWLAARSPAPTTRWSPRRSTEHPAQHGPSSDSADMCDPRRTDLQDRAFSGADLRQRWSAWALRIVCFFCCGGLCVRVCVRLSLCVVCVGAEIFVVDLDVVCPVSCMWSRLSVNL